MNEHEARRVARVFSEDAQRRPDPSAVTHWLADATLALQRILPGYSWAELIAETSGIAQEVIAGAWVCDWGYPQYPLPSRIPSTLRVAEARRLMLVVIAYSCGDPDEPVCAEVIQLLQREFPLFDWLELLDTGRGVSVVWRHP